jgi:hypothetical protein
MSIRSNIEAIMATIAGGDNALGLEIQAKSVAAIKGGEGSAAWDIYMDMFVQNSTQLARLTPTDATKDDPEMDIARTYLIGNGTCGAETTGTTLLQGIDDTLDKTLS